MSRRRFLSRMDKDVNEPDDNGYVCEDASEAYRASSDAFVESLLTGTWEQAKAEAKENLDRHDDLSAQ